MPILLFLTVLSVACTSKPETVYVTKVEKQYPPAAYLSKCDTSKTVKLEGNKWRDLGKAYSHRGYALDDCANKLDKIITWSKAD